MSEKTEDSVAYLKRAMSSVVERFVIINMDLEKGLTRHILSSDGFTLG